MLDLKRRAAKNRQGNHEADYAKTVWACLPWMVVLYAGPSSAVACAELTSRLQGKIVRKVHAMTKARAAYKMSPASW